MITFAYCGVDDRARGRKCLLQNRFTNILSLCHVHSTNVSSIRAFGNTSREYFRHV